MKFPIKFHQSCFESINHILMKKRYEMERLSREIEDLEKRTGEYKEQINQAIKEKKRTFDKNEYKIKVKKVSKRKRGKK